MYNQAFNADSLLRGICFANFTPRCESLRRQAGSALPVNLALSEIMHKPFTKEEIFRLISNIHEFEKVEVSEKGAAYSLVLSNGNKAIEISWLYELTEVFLNYFQGSKLVFEDWFECFEQESLESFIEYKISINSLS